MYILFPPICQSNAEADHHGWLQLRTVARRATSEFQGPSPTSSPQFQQSTSPRTEAESSHTRPKGSPMPSGTHRCVEDCGMEVQSRLLRPQAPDLRSPKSRESAIHLQPESEERVNWTSSLNKGSPWHTRCHACEAWMEKTKGLKCHPPSHSSLVRPRPPTARNLLKTRKGPGPERTRESATSEAF